MEVELEITDEDEEVADVVVVVICPY